MGTHSHKKHGLEHLKVAILTVSTTRNMETDTAGKWMAKQAKREGHTIVSHKVIPDDFLTIGGAVLDMVRKVGADAVIVTGGTGLTRSDVTIEACRPLFHKELSAFGPVFAQLSYEEIYGAAILSRATAGTIGSSVVYCIPGSLGACKLACRELIFPEMGHLIAHVRTG